MHRPSGVEFGPTCTLERPEIRDTMEEEGRQYHARDAKLLEGKGFRYIGEHVSVNSSYRNMENIQIHLSR